MHKTSNKMTVSLPCCACPQPLSPPNTALLMRPLAEAGKNQASHTVSSCSQVFFLVSSAVRN